MKTKITLIFIAFFVVILISVSIQKTPPGNIRESVVKEAISKSGVCPPFLLYDEDGNVINPVAGINTDKPYSPRQTCGKCHDYEKITEGFHFQQGKVKIWC